MDIALKIAKEFDIRKKQVEDTIALIDEGNTIPFIARYRKEATGGLSDELLRDLDESLTYLRNLESRKEEVIRLIDEQDKLTEDLEKEILAAQKLQRVEDLYRPYKQKRRTRATKAREKGLEPLSEIILEGTNKAIEEVAEDFIDEEKEVNTIEDAIEGAKDIIAEEVSDNADFRKYIRGVWYNKTILTSQKAGEDKDGTFEMYYDYSEAVKKMANHRVLAVNRGEKEGILKISLDTPDDIILDYLKRNTISEENKNFSQTIGDAIEDSYKRLISPSMEREIRNILTEDAEEEAIKVFAKNTKPLLMIPPVTGVRVMAIDPSFRTGCKIAVLDETGKLLDYTTIYPNEPQNKVEESKAVMKDLIEKYDIDIIPIGNGTASRETETVVSDTISEMDRGVYYTIVSEAGASVYSASKLATEEYPDVNVSIRGAISIGRRLQDPLAELVKIDPKSIGVGQYQHDLNQTKLTDSLTSVVEDCVNTVGVDLNTASPSLLNYVAGLSPAVSKNIVKHREEEGKFNDRKEIKKVKRLGAKTFEQCAGFLRIAGGENPLDNTGVHPESYKITFQLIDKLGYTKEDIEEGKLKNIDEKIDEYGSIEDLAEDLDVGLPTLEDIVAEIKKPGRDPREDMPKPVFRSDVLKMEDLKKDMVLGGTVRNVVDFGAFVDIGVKQDGLVHVSQLSDKFIKNPMDMVSVGDSVKVQVMDVDIDKGRISLTMKGLKK